MAYGVNRVGKQTRASFQLANNIIKFQHPFLIGQLANKSLDTIDVTACLVMDNAPFNAEPDSESAKTVKMLDGSTVTVCNKSLSGVINLKAVEITGKVATGDFIAACKLIKSLGDSVGGLLTVIRRLGSECLVTVFYGVTVAKCPDLKLGGADVAVYPISLSYAGYIEANGTQEQALQHIWTVGNNLEVEAIFKPYGFDTRTGALWESYSEGNVTGILDRLDKNYKSFSLRNSEFFTGTDVASQYLESRGVTEIMRYVSTPKEDGSIDGVIDQFIIDFPQRVRK